MKLLAPTLDFELPNELEASVPPEERGSGRDDVRLMVSSRSSGKIEHKAFVELPGALRPGDLLVVNRSATVNAALDVTVNSEAAVLHFSRPLEDGTWVVELRHMAADQLKTSAWLDLSAGMEIQLPNQASARLLAPASPGCQEGAVRLWAAELGLSAAVADYLAKWGRPIAYHHLAAKRALADYQTVFAQDSGSAEMPSAARPFTTELVTRLIVSGIGVAPVLLHCGVSSPEAHEVPQPEPFEVPAQTAQRVNAVLRLGGRVIAVGTGVVRALESAAVAPGLILPAHGLTELVIDPGYSPQVVSGVLSGWHEPGASHLAMLEAIAGRKLLENSYREALARGYLWHEFGDSHLILP